MNMRCLILCLLPSVSLANQVCFTDSMPETTPSTQYLVHGDGTVSHVTTGLMWMQCADGLSDENCATGETQLYTWSGALQRADSINNTGGFAGYTDWRVPNISELLTIVEEQCTQPAINATAFPATERLFFWSSSPNFNNNDATWFVDFKFGSSGNVARSGSYPVRLVRSIQ